MKLWKRGVVVFDKSLSWKANVIVVMGDGKWKSRRQIKNALGLDHEFEKARCRAFSSYLLRLVKSGHLIRAEAPECLTSDPNDHVKYVYKRTSKHFKEMDNVMDYPAYDKSEIRKGCEVSGVPAHIAGRSTEDRG